MLREILNGLLRERDVDVPAIEDVRSHCLSWSTWYRMALKGTATRGMDLSKLTDEELAYVKRLVISASVPAAIPPGN